MKINKVSLYNFNSFEGRNDFDFSITDDCRNIILIGGKNGAGKTSLFTAIKIALYGPLAFGYVGMNPRYVVKIRECINSKAFQTMKVESGVQITISLMMEREIREYEITRKWDYSGQKLIENYSVKCGGQLLNEQELSYFQNYLQSLIPPDLFEFFLFDGEAVGSIFSTNSYNAYVKNALYTLCGLDTFEIIRKYTKGYAGKAASEDEAAALKEYENLKKKAEETSCATEQLAEKLKDSREELERLETDILELETEFKKAGGITETERDSMLKELDRCEKIKAETSAKIRIFVEGIMPFYIVREFTGAISEQLDVEERGEIYRYIQWKLNREEIRGTLGEGVSEDTVDALMDMLLRKFKPKGYREGTESMHDLSREDTGRVQAMIASLEDFNAEDMVETVRRRKKASERAMEINKTLRNAMTDEDAARFAERQKILLEKRSELNRRIYETERELEQMNARVETLTQQKDRAWQRVRDTAQNQHVFELSSGLSNMMDALLRARTAELRTKLETRIVENLQRIFRKNNLITHIEMDDDFRFNLYQDAVYTAEELVHLMQNLGRQGFALMIGRESTETLYRRFGVDSLGSLQKILMYDPDERFELHQNIDLGRLSRGERQIFILALYQAVIELSGKDIPFVIDTPYARIDANHRKEISEKFFPNISGQVVILSTDEEINEEYYRILKPYIAREYMLVNDENHNRTTVEKRYFFEVES